MKANIDVGASVGNSALAIAAEWPDVPVYAFEPCVYDLLKRNVSENALIKPVRAAVGLENRALVPFYMNTPLPTSSLKPLVDNPVVRKGSPELRGQSIFNIATLRLDHFLEVRDITEVPFLKIDVQGADLEVLQSLGDRIDCVRKIQVEMHSIRPGDVPDWQYVGETKEADVVVFLAEHGFRLVKKLERDHGMWMDGVFKR